MVLSEFYATYKNKIFMQSKRWHCMCTLFCDNNKLNVLDSGCFLRHSCWGVLAKIRHFFQSGQGITLWEQLKTLALRQFLNPLHSILPDLDWSQKNYARWWITIMADNGEWWMYCYKKKKHYLEIKWEVSKLSSSKLKPLIIIS